MKKKARAGKLFEELIAIMSRLRGPDGCPWDKRQDHDSLVPYLFSEAREVRQAVKKKDWENLAEELGDVLLQVVFHSQVAVDRGGFDITDVITSINQKLIRRHPHIFGGMKAATPEEVTVLWNNIKKQEKALKKEKARQAAGKIRKKTV